MESSFIKDFAMKPGNGDEKTADRGYSDRLQSALSMEARAERLLAEYLRMWGLRDPATIAMHCRGWARGAAGNGPNSTLSTCYRAALERAVGDFDEWLDYLAGAVSSDPQDAQSCRGLVAIDVQASIDKHPAALFDRKTPAPGWIEQLRQAARPVVPRMQPTAMTAQPLGELPAALRPTRWRQALARALAVTVNFACFRWRVSQ